jgi:hypothetical protein
MDWTGTHVLRLRFNESGNEIFISMLLNAKTELCFGSGQRLFTPIDQNKSNIFEVTFLGKFAKLKKSLLTSSCLTVRRYVRINNSTPNGRNFMKFSTLHFSNI